MCWINSLVIAESRNIIRHRMEKDEKLPILTYEIGGTYENVYAAQDEDIQVCKGDDK